MYCFHFTRSADHIFVLQVTISKDDTVILDGSGEKKSIEERCEQVCVKSDATALELMLTSLLLDFSLFCYLFTQLSSTMQIRSAVELSTSDYDKEKLQERLAKLSGGVAVLKVALLFS